MIPFFLILTAFLSYVGARFIKQYAKFIYGFASLLSIFTIYMIWTEKAWAHAEWLSYLMGGLYASLIGTSFIILVMYLGVLSPESKFRKRLMPIRSELSITACLLILGHNIGFWKDYLRDLFTASYKLSPSEWFALFFAAILFVLQLILLVTSFPFVRRQMNPKQWKTIQKLAYPYFICIYLHYMALYGPWLESLHWYNLTSTIAYSLIFLTYAFLKVKKHYGRQRAVLLTVLYLLLASSLAYFGWTLNTAYYAHKKELGIHSKASTKKLSEPYRDGLFEGSGQGKESELKVQIEIKDQQIVSIEVLNHEEGAHPDLHWAMNSVLPAILEKQSLEVEGVPDSKEENEGLLVAISTALNQAKSH